MKHMNTMMWVSNMIEDLVKAESRIRNAVTFEDVKSAALEMRGYLNAAHTVTNTMICKENNGFTGEIDSMLMRWEGRCYGAMAERADELKVEDHDMVINLYKMRDELLALANE